MKQNDFTERYELAIERIKGIAGEDKVSPRYAFYFNHMADFILRLNFIYELRKNKKYNVLTVSELKEINDGLFGELSREYEISFANPEYANRCFGKQIGKYLSYLYTVIAELIPYVFEERLERVVIGVELFLEIYYEFVSEEKPYQGLKSAIHYYVNDYMELFVSERIQESLDPSFTFATDIIMNSDLDDVSYLYQYGSYITENEIQTAQFLSTLSEEEIEKLSRTYTEGYRIGFEENKIDLSKKETVNIRYHIGFEKIVREAVKQFADMGLKPVIFRSTLTKEAGYISTCPNRQYKYDHRFDSALYLNKAYLDRYVKSFEKAYQEHKNLADVYAGPAVIEVFGEKTFSPENRADNCNYTKSQQELDVEMRKQLGLVTNRYIKRDEYSFTIIAFPIPEIGEKFKEIFKETVKVNTLDVKVYREIQEKLIAALDQGEKVYIKGGNGNKTDLFVSLHHLEQPEKQTNFENCLADVNIPVGEVFTSPVLKGTDGVLHITEVYLEDFKYKELEIHFKDGMTAEYTCKNYDTEEENKKFVNENLLHHRESLPMGEFAIGTNTTAYAMGKNFDISHKLPILIAEKTGPHFAIGDTCYSMSEEIEISNPDGKEVIAKDNEISMKRKEDIRKAYFYCHTDITIPYDELAEISVILKDGTKIFLIQNGRFVLQGTEGLNEPLDKIMI